MCDADHKRTIRVEVPMQQQQQIPAAAIAVCVGGMQETSHQTVGFLYKRCHG
jgi:hypothetical protein